MFSISFSCFFRFSRFSALSIHHFLNPTQTAPGSHPRVPGAQGRGAAVHRADAEALPSPLLPQRPPRLRHAACNRRRMPRGAGTEGSRAGVPSRGGGAGRGPPGSWPVSHRRLGLEPRFHSAAGRREERGGVLRGHGCGDPARRPGPSSALPTRAARSLGGLQLSLLWPGADRRRRGPGAVRADRGSHGWRLGREAGGVRDRHPGRGQF